MHLEVTHTHLVSVYLGGVTGNRLLAKVIVYHFTKIQS